MSVGDIVGGRGKSGVEDGSSWDSACAGIFFCWVEFTVDNGKILVRGVGSAGEI
jgi:hypothetical protein